MVKQNHIQSQKFVFNVSEDNMEMEQEKRSMSKSECEESCKEVPYNFRRNCYTKCDTLG